MQKGWLISFARSCSLPRQIFVILLIDSSVGARPVTERRCASIGDALGEGFTEVNIASTYDWDHLFPWGSHPELDPLWSNGKVLLAHDGCEATRLDKTRLVSEHPIALETLRVCYENPDSLYNCGRCRKCLHHG